MKTLLTINGVTLLLPAEANNDNQLGAAIKILRGAVTVDEQTHYGPDGKDRYEDAAGYFMARVKRSVAATIRLELVDDSEVISAREFSERAESFEKKDLSVSA